MGKKDKVIVLSATWELTNSKELKELEKGDLKPTTLSYKIKGGEKNKMKNTLLISGVVLTILVLSVVALNQLNSIPSADLTFQGCKTAFLGNPVYDAIPNTIQGNGVLWVKDTPEQINQIICGR